jgi:hypothetical protein
MSSNKNFGFGGFKFNKAQSSSSSHSSSTDKSKTSYQTSAKPSYGASFSRQHKTEEEYILIIITYIKIKLNLYTNLKSYFEEDAELKKSSKECEYQPASDSSSSSSEEDPLDSFMANIEV